MLERSLQHIAFSKDWGRQMRFISGPRQSGKTTLAKIQLRQNRTPRLYYLWDLRSIRNRYRDNELFTQDQAPTRKNLWICFDEIHKMPKWKNILKGIFDASPQNYKIKTLIEYHPLVFFPKVWFAQRRIL